MPYHKILLQPGVSTQKSKTLNQTSWSTSNLIRWRTGLLEKLGGWAAVISTPLIGVCRALHAWSDTGGFEYLAAGTNERLTLYGNGGFTDITPIRQTSDLTSAFSTVALSASVTITDAANGASAGDWINIEVETAVGGIVLYGYYPVATIIDSDNYTIEAASPAISTEALGGNTPLFDTLNTSDIVTVTLVNHGYSINDVFIVRISTMVGGLTLDGEYLISTVPDADTFTIQASSGASSTASQYENGDTTPVAYLLPSAPSTDLTSVGYGGGPYGSGTWGISSASTSIIPLRNWFLDNFGEDLMAVPTNGSLYVWVPPIANNNPATLVATAPLANAGMFVAMPQAQVVCLGAEAGGTQDPLLVRWSDAGDYTNWTASATNQAGSFRLSRGSMIVGGMQAPQTGLIWTDVDLWSMNYVQPPFVYSFTVVGTGCGLLAPKAKATLGRNTFFMSVKGFFVFSDGGVQPLDCPVWDAVFKDLDTDNAAKCFAAPNSLFNEVVFYYPSLSGGTGEIDAYVKFNVLEGEWDYGALVRTAWIDENIFGPPIGVDGNGVIQQHEVSINADGEAMTGVSAMTGYADISDGLIYIFIDQIIPDFVWAGSTGDPSVTVTIYATNYPGESPITEGPFTVTPNTEYIPVRIRARQMAFKVESDDMDVFWRLGAVRYRAAPAGRVG